MRAASLMATTLLLSMSPATAQTNSYYAERGHWSVWNSSSACMAVNRPAADFNFAPYNALQITVRPRSAISVDVFFWPGAVITERDYKLQLSFNAGDATLPAKATFGDYVLASGPDMGLWRKLEDSSNVSVRVVGEPLLVLAFTLDDIHWVLSALQACSGYLPKE
jgi:hypothetical protein